MVLHILRAWPKGPDLYIRATFRVFKIERKLYGREDVPFLERVFQKLLLNFTWWVNRKDQGGNNVFEGGFLGLDNIGVFNRSEPLPTGGVLRQADGTAWMAFYCLNMYVLGSHICGITLIHRGRLNIALELAKHNPVYEDIASKFFEVSRSGVLSVQCLTLASCSTSSSLPMP